ncbi:hypothetical protein BH11ACT4_BH11ACT4_06220 [soil metagenome]
MAARRITVILLALYTGLVLIITMTPQGRAPGVINRVVNAVLDAVHGRGLLLWVDYSVVEFTANILMFVPLGVLVALLVARRLRWILFVVGTAFSTAIELTQTVIPGRVPDVRDVMANSAGFLLGAAIVLALRQGRKGRSRAE